ncbi:hypothetical protein B0O99DRAFT_684959 [Bisporella sp. PMI_857]|nr:hypothetical protein B0O99DRAFT_684959 [Bisporella sp. PMI_857]
MSSSSELYSKGKIPRASRPKVKTGCLTCKKRHVKCDETKPECLKCCNFGRKCEGYPADEDNTPPPSRPSSRTRTLISKTPQRIPSPILPSFTFTDDLEYNYFLIFRDQTAKELSGGFDPSLWDSLVIQACDNGSIRELASAIGALSLAGVQSTTQSALLYPNLHVGVLQNDQNGHLQYALMQYGKALKEIRETVRSGQDTTRVALIAALLIFVFESLHGDTPRSVTPIHSAIDLILKKVSTMQRTYRGSRTNPNRPHSSLPFEEDILSAFLRLDGPALVLKSGQTEQSLIPLSSHGASSLSATDAESGIPSGFASISEARIYLEDIEWRCYKYRGFNFPTYGHLFGRLRGWYLANVPGYSGLPTTPFKQWAQAFTPLFEYSMTAAGSANFVSASILRIQALSWEVLERSFNKHETLDADVDNFQCLETMLSLSRQLIDSPGFSRGFIFDEGIINPLVIIFHLCPVRDLRVQIHEVMKSIVPRRENVWDSRTVAAAAERILNEEIIYGGNEENYRIDPEFAQERGLGEGVYHRTFRLQAASLNVEHALKQFLGI